MPSYRVEFHSHCQGDVIDVHLRHTIHEHIDRAREVGLNAIAITWHRRVFHNPEAVAYARDRGILLIPGIEAEPEGRHLLVLNLASEEELPVSPSWDQIRALRARRPDVLVIAPHPFYPHPTCLGHRMNANVDCIDAVEWCMLHVGWLPSRINPNLRASRWAQRYGKPVIACSDAHTLAAIGTNASTVEADALTPAAIFAGIRAGRVSFHRRALELAPLLIHTTKAVAAQPKHFARVLRQRLGLT